jgi:signal transduction histidine kinase
VARLVAQYHGGEIRCVDRDDGAGVVFEITLPRSAQAG